MTTHKKTVLIVEDETPLLAALDKKIKGTYNTLTAWNGKEGLDKALKNHPDMILLDIDMPIMNGLEMAKELRKDAWGKNAKIILLTNVDASEKLADALEEGIFEYIVKSTTTIENILTSLEKHLL